MKLHQGLLIQANNLKSTNKLSKRTIGYSASVMSILGGIQRSELEENLLVCALISPDGTSGVFVDKLGKEFVIPVKDLSSRITYVDSNFIKREVSKYKERLVPDANMSGVLARFLKKPDLIYKYKGWKSGDKTIMV